jgi:glutaconate CoA-transferase subunit B
MNAKIETPDMMIYAMASEIEDFNTVLHGVSSPLPILAMSVARNTHAPDMAYISGAEGVDPELNRIYPSSAIPTLRIWLIFQVPKAWTLN